MDRNAILRVAKVVYAWMVPLSLGCSPPSTVAEGRGGDGQGGSQSGAAGGGGGGSGGALSDAGVLALKLDVLPPWWAAADAPPDKPPAPTADANCGMLTSKTTRQPVDVMLVLDRSASMEYSIARDCYCSSGGGRLGSQCSDTGTCTTRWNALKPAVSATLADASYVNWGLKFFPSPSRDVTCNEDTVIEVPIAATSAAAIASQIDTATFAMGTPTAKALDAATAYLKTRTDAGGKFILLATDGEPNCAGEPPNINSDDVAGATSAAAAAYAAGFKVYVIGIGPSVGNLTQLAKAGGTTDFYPASSPQDLTSALSSISRLVGSCTFEAREAPLDENNVAVYLNGQQVPRDADNGWTYGSSAREVVLIGDYCKQMSSGNQVDVQILFGCPGQPGFPPNIY